MITPELRAAEPLSIVDYATGVSGAYCIGRRNTQGFWSYWNPSGWAGSGYVFIDRKLAESVLAMIAVIEAAKAMHVEYDQDLYTTATNKAFKAALAKLEQK